MEFFLEPEAMHQGFINIWKQDNAVAARVTVIVTFLGRLQKTEPSKETEQ